MRPAERDQVGAMTFAIKLASELTTTVFIGGPPTISMMGMAAKLGFAALGKLAKSQAAKKLAKRSKAWRKKMADALGLKKPSFLRCVILRAEPVNLLDGSVVVEQQDFNLPGRIAIDWTRTYSSSQLDHTGLLGPGWQTLADTRLEVSAETGEVVVHCVSTGMLFFDCLPRQKGEVGVQLEAMDGSRLVDLGAELQVITKDDRILSFAKHQAVRGAQGQLLAAADCAAMGDQALDVFAECLRLAQLALGEITGEFTSDDLLGVIFGQFCIGK